MVRPASVQVTRHWRVDDSVTFALRVRMSGGDETVPLGNATDGWDEARAERARRQLLAKIDLGLWTPGSVPGTAEPDREPRFVDLATDWLADRLRDPAIRSRTTEDDRWRLTRYLIPFFGEMQPSQITALTLKQYRRHLHQENAQILAARDAGAPLSDPRSRQRLRPLSNGSINKTLRTLAAILDEAEDAGWVSRNIARGPRARESVERRTADVLDADELFALLEAADHLDHAKHKPATLRRADQVRALRDQRRLTWTEIASMLGVSRPTAVYLYGCRESDAAETGPRRAVIATLGFAGLRAGELCALDKQHVDLSSRRIHVRDAKTAAGIRVIDIRPRLMDELATFRPVAGDAAMDRPAYPTTRGTRRDRNNVNKRIIAPVVAHANTLRASRQQPPIRAHVTPHTFRRTYITIMLAAGFDVPYVQDQVGHLDPTTTLAMYARVIRRPDSDAVRTEMRALLGEDKHGPGL
jgi:integrase